MNLRGSLSDFSRRVAPGRSVGIRQLPLGATALALGSRAAHLGQLLGLLSGAASGAAFGTAFADFSGLSATRRRKTERGGRRRSTFTTPWERNPEIGRGAGPVHGVEGPIIR